MKKLLLGAGILIVTGTARAGDDAAAGTDGTATSWEGATVLLVERCDKDDRGAWDYPSCVRALRHQTGHLLCARGNGSYKWSFQVGSEKSKLYQVTTCKTS